MDLLAYIRTKIATGCAVDFSVLEDLAKVEKVVAVKKIRSDLLSITKKQFASTSMELRVPANTQASDLSILLATAGVGIWINFGGGWAGAPVGSQKRQQFETLLQAFCPPLAKNNVVQKFPDRKRDGTYRHMSVNFVWKHIAPNSNTAHAKALQRAGEGVTSSSFLPPDSAAALNKEIGAMLAAGLQKCLEAWVKNQTIELQTKRKRITTILFRSSTFQKVWDLEATDGFTAKAKFHYVYYALTEPDDKKTWICNHYESPANMVSRDYVPTGYSELKIGDLVTGWGVKEHEKTSLIAAFTEPFKESDDSVLDYPRIYVSYA